MAFKIFFDANILLDFSLKRDNYESAKQVITLVIDNKVQGYITPSIVHILGHYLGKYYGNAKAKEIILTLLVDIKVIDIPHEIVLIALNSKIDDIEDALQYYSAIHHKIDYFISGDKYLQKSGIATLPVYSLKEFISEFV